MVDDQQRSRLPSVDPPFRGKIAEEFKDSEADYPEYLNAPEGAPNVLLIVGDDIGYGHMSAFGGPANTPVFDRPAGQGLIFTNGKPTFQYNWLAQERYTITSSEPLPAGKCTVRFDFAYDGRGPGKGGTGTRSVNGRNVAEGRIEKTVPVYFSTDDTFDVGEDWGTPMSAHYEPPFKFTGILKKVTVQAKAP